MSVLPALQLSFLSGFVISQPIHKMFQEELVAEKDRQRNRLFTSWRIYCHLLPFWGCLKLSSNSIWYWKYFHFINKQISPSKATLLLQLKQNAPASSAFSRFQEWPAQCLWETSKQGLKVTALFLCCVSTWHLEVDCHYMQRLWKVYHVAGIGSKKVVESDIGPANTSGKLQLCYLSPVSGTHKYTAPYLFQFARKRR